MKGKQKISLKGSRIDFIKEGKDFKKLPKGLEEDELLELTCQFKLGRFENRDKFILAYTRIVVWKALTFAKYRDEVDDLVGVGLLTLMNVPYEVKERMIDFNLAAYTLSRVKTKCIEYRRKNHLLRVQKDAVLKGKAKVIHRDNETNLENIGKNESKVSELFETLEKCVVIEFERLVLKYRIEGYKDEEIAQIFGCSKSKISRTRTTLEKRFDEWNASS